MCPSSLQSVYVFSWEPCLQGQALHCFVPTHGLVVRAQCACRCLPDAGHHALPRLLLHLSDKVGQWWTRVLHEGEHLRDPWIADGANNGSLVQRCDMKQNQKTQLRSSWFYAAFVKNMQAAYQERKSCVVKMGYSATYRNTQYRIKRNLSCKLERKWQLCLLVKGFVWEAQQKLHSYLLTNNGAKISLKNLDHGAYWCG